MISSDDKTRTGCPMQMLPIRDALEVINGKWKLTILVSILQGNRRFSEIERSIPKMTSKVLAKELRDLEEHQLIQRITDEDQPALVEYTPTEHCLSLEKVMLELHAWGASHRKKILGK